MLKAPASADAIKGFPKLLYRFFLRSFLTPEQQERWPSLAEYSKGCEILGPGEVVPFSMQQSSAAQQAASAAQTSTLSFTITVTAAIAAAIKDKILSLATAGKLLVIPELGMKGPLTVSGKQMPRIFPVHLENVPVSITAQDLIEVVENARAKCTAGSDGGYPHVY